jgi:uncharacterized protein YcfJ
LYVLLAMGVVTGAALAEGFRGYATVIDVQPIVETTHAPVMRQVCSEPDSRAHLSVPLATTIGEDIRRRKRAWQSQTSCATVTESQSRTKVVAYRVTYRYRGHTKTTQLSYHPGDRLPVNVSLSPLPRVGEGKTF